MVYSDLVQVSLRWRKQQGFRIWFKEPWLSEGDAIATRSENESPLPVTSLSRSRRPLPANADTYICRSVAALRWLELQSGTHSYSTSGSRSSFSEPSVSSTTRNP